MQAVFYQLALSLAVFAGLVTLMQPQRHTQARMQTLQTVQRAGVDYIGAHCQALPGTVTQAMLQAAGNLPDPFDSHGATFTWRMAEHPVVTVNVSGAADYLAFLPRHTLGGFEADGSYTFIPDHDATGLRAANNGYNLFAYAGNDFSCNPL
ncbi:MAG: hypothetical protein OXE97_08365 [Gammaproteobacteria bacterium]|nr:hypothetical protein [Gammaproteobacteria bacterium]